jgi:dimethylaniline monooxygenase (N-oxide forming)
MDYISRYVDPPEDSPPVTNFTVDLAPFPSRFLPDGRAVFPMSKRKDAIRMAKREVKPDTVIYATGYTQEFNFLDKNSGYRTPGEADIRNVAASGDESVGFIGFVRPGVGNLYVFVAFLSVYLIFVQVPSPQSQRCSLFSGFR